MKYFGELNQRFGVAIRDTVVKDIAKGRAIGPNKIRHVTTFLAIIILITPYCVAAVGAVIIALNLDSVPAIVIGTIILAVGYYLRAPKPRNSKETLRRTNAPNLFSLLDEIAKLLDAPKIDGVHVDSEFNAYMAAYGTKERILGIGAPLWLALDHRERLAVLSHEIAHLTNKDPARSHLAHGALGTLSRWHDLSRPPVIVDHETNINYSYDDRGLMGQAFGFLFGGAIAAIAHGFEKLIFADSQRAEYLADLTATSVSGVAAGNASLKKLILSPLGEEVLQQTYFDGSSDIAIFEDMARMIREPDANQAARLYAEATELMHTVDSSHPPTRYRMEVVAAAGNTVPAIEANTLDWVTIDQELAPEFARAEQKLLSQIITQ